MDQLPFAMVGQMDVDPASTSTTSVSPTEPVRTAEWSETSRRKNQLLLESPEKRAERLAKQRERGRKKRAEESPEERTARLTKQKERIRHARATEPVEKREERLVRMREKGRLSRAMETSTKRETRLKAARERASQRREAKRAAKVAAKLEAAKAKRREANRLRQSLKRAVETDEELEVRRTASRERQAKRRSMETAEQREIRLKKNRERQAAIRANETDEERERRLKMNRERLARKRQKNWGQGSSTSSTAEQEENIAVKIENNSIQQSTEMSGNGVTKCTHCGQTFPQQDDLTKHLCGERCGNQGTFANAPSVGQPADSEDEERASSHAGTTPSRTPTPPPPSSQGNLPPPASLAQSIAPLPELALDDLSELEVQQTDDVLEELPVQPRNEMVLAHRQERENVNQQGLPLHVCGWCGHLFANPLDLSRHMQNHSQRIVANKGPTYHSDSIETPSQVAGERSKMISSHGGHPLGHEPPQSSSSHPPRGSPHKCAHPRCTQIFPTLSTLWKHTLVNHKDDMQASLGTLSGVGSHITGLRSSLHQAFMQREGLDTMSASSVMQLAVETANSPTCNLCGEIFSSLTTLLWHIQCELALEHVRQGSVHGRRSPAGLSADDTLSASPNNSRHTQWSHVPNPGLSSGSNRNSLSVSALVSNQRQPGYPKPLYKCDRCDQLFQSPVSMLYHVLDHTEKNLLLGSEAVRHDGERRGETRGTPGKTSQAYGGHFFSYVVP